MSKKVFIKRLADGETKKLSAIDRSYCMSIDGKNRKVVGRINYDSAFFLNAFDDWIYYSNDFGELGDIDDIEDEDLVLFFMLTKIQLSTVSLRLSLHSSRVLPVAHTPGRSSISP